MTAGTLPYEVVNQPEPVTQAFVIYLNVFTEIPEFEISKEERTQSVVVRPIPLDIEDAFTNVVNLLLDGKVDSYYDQDRELKTLLNFGTDFQSLLTNWKLSNNGIDIIGKLYNPLPPEVDIDDDTYISREVMYPNVDRVYVLRAPAPRISIYLRPPNRNIVVANIDGISVNNVTMQSLLSSGAFDLITPTDSATQEWFTTALEGAELNIDYSNYANFVFYSTAENRLIAFKNKLSLLETYTAAIGQASASFASVYSGSEFTSSDAYTATYTLSQKKQDLIRTFDPYERFLYYETEVPFSGTFSGIDDEDDETFDFSDVTWPKISGSVAPIASASTWYDSQIELAQKYDNFNQNSFINNLPDFIVNDEGSSEYLLFFSLIGHIMDSVKLYVDRMLDIFDRGNDPLEGLSQDLVWDIIKAFGITIPNQYSTEQLLNYTLGDETVYRERAVETWKRFLHNHILMLKSKGTKTAFDILLNSYGILPTTLRIRESITPSYFYQTASFETYVENSNVLPFSGSQYLEIPWASTSAPEYTLQVRFATTETSSMNLITTPTDEWTLKLNSSQSYHQIQLLTGSSVVMSSSYLTLATGEYHSVQITYDAAGSTLYVKKTDDIGELEIDFKQTEPSTAFSDVWATPTELYLGGLTAPTFTGSIDEFRVWGEQISESVLNNWTKYPALYNGNTTSSAVDSLWVRLSFNVPQDLGTDVLLPNESPYTFRTDASSSLLYVSASGFAVDTTFPYSMRIFTRTVYRLSQTAGGQTFDNNKIKIADAPTLKYLSGSSVPVLSRTISIIDRTAQKEQQLLPVNFLGFYLSQTDTINDSIIRSVGNIDVNQYLGDARDLTAESYDVLDTLNQFYWDNYAYTYDVNEFTDQVKDLFTSIFEQAETFVPASSNVVTGVVVEPTILERYRYPLKKPIADDEDILNLEASPTTSQPDSIVGENTDHDTILSVSEDDDVIQAENTDNFVSLDVDEDVINTVVWYDALEDTIDINEEDILETIAEYTDYSPTIDINEEMLNSRVRFNTQTLFENHYLIPTYTSYTIDGLNKDSPDNIAATTYFTHPLGYVGIRTYELISNLNSNVTTDRGTWSFGTTYFKNDIVVQPTGSYINDPLYTNGNGKEFYAIGDNFQSNVPPYGDPTHWREVPYVLHLIKAIRKAVLISGSLSLVDITSGLSPVVGYLPKHYRFFRDTGTGFIRSRYTGVVQTSDTTIDGKSPIEVLRSTTDVLVVKDTEDPIILQQKVAGPILDVESREE